jgi:hypothetical protein
MWVCVQEVGYFVKGSMEPVVEEHGVFLGVSGEKATAHSFHVDSPRIIVRVSDGTCRILLVPVLLYKLSDITLEAVCIWALVFESMMGKDPAHKWRLMEESLHDRVLIACVAAVVDASALLARTARIYWRPAEVHLGSL